MSSVEFSVQSNFVPLNKLRGGLNKDAGVKVGVLGSTETRRDGDLFGNAEVGLIAEVGSATHNVPARSWLVMPLTTKKDRIEAVFSKPGVQQKVMDGDIVGVLTAMGHAAEEVIDDAFKSGGFGQWAPNKPSTIARKGSSKPLIDTSQLRRAVTSKPVIGNK